MESLQSTLLGFAINTMKLLHSKAGCTAAALTLQHGLASWPCLCLAPRHLLFLVTSYYLTLLQCDTVKEGEVFRVETQDWTGGQIKDDDSAEDMKNINLTLVGVCQWPAPFTNPLLMCNCKQWSHHVAHAPGVQTTAAIECTTRMSTCYTNLAVELVSGSLEPAA